jgi:hypothetical protein
LLYFDRTLGSLPHRFAAEGIGDKDSVVAVVPARAT